MTKIIKLTLILSESQLLTWKNISANLANMNSILNENDELDPYRRRQPVFAVGDPSSGSDMGVHVAEITIDESPLNRKYDPGSPYADLDGYVAYPNVYPVIEHMNAMEAARSYEANIAAIEASKSMMSAAFQIIA